MKNLFFTVIAALLFSLQLSNASVNEQPGGIALSKSLFCESLAQFVSGNILKMENSFEDGKAVITTVMWIPTYYGYHSFMGVLDSYIVKHTSLTLMRTWRMAERRLYVIHLSQENISVTIMYDSLDSLLYLTTPEGY